MMKKHLMTLWTLVLISAIGGAQSGQPVSHEMSSKMSYTQLKNTYRVETHIGYARAWQQHSLELSGIITLFTDHAETQSLSPRPVGVGLDYTYHVPCAFSALDINLSAGSSYRLISNAWSGNYYSEDQEYVPVYTSSQEHMVDFHMGYGFRLWLGHHFFIGHSLQGGIFNSNLRAGRDNTAEKVDIEGTQHDFRRYGNVGWLLQASITAGYRF